MTSTTDEFDQIIQSLFVEVLRAEDKWPHWPEDLVYGAAIVGEEAALT